MMPKRISLKCGKSIVFPSMFVHLNYQTEAQIIRKMVARYSEDSGCAGLSQIDGIAVSIKDWSRISPHILLGYIGDEPEYKLVDRIRVIDPSLYLLFTGTMPDKNAVLGTMDASPTVKNIIHRISSLKSRGSKIDKSIDDLYPVLDTHLIRNLLEYQIRNGSDILISPSVPVTSLRRIRDQIRKAWEMNRVSRILLNTVFSAYRDERDLMHVLTLNPSVLKTDYFEGLKEAALVNNPDHVGIRIMNLDEGNTSQIWSLLRFIRELSESIPVHVFNVREFGYVTFHHGAFSMTTPVATDPYFRRAESDEAPPRKGSYYHPIDMTNDTYDILLEKTRSSSYRFPCHCEICGSFERVLNVDDTDWNKFRRVHFLLVKNMEMRELRETATPLGIALKDKFGRSQQTAWLPYLD